MKGDISMTERINDFCNTGWTPPESHKICNRCGKLNDSLLSNLCQDCQHDDEVTAKFRTLVLAIEQDAAEEKDRQYEISFARYGGAQ
jgi:RNA polymerase subunit RPABC4/transcription elongation factor Spt4